MASIERFEDLVIWKESRNLVREIYVTFAKMNDFGFKDQIQRASVSVMNNISEGFERESKVEFKRFLYISKSSAGEVRSMIYLALDLGYIEEEKHKKLLSDCVKLSSGIMNLIKYLII